ncbi:MAG: S-methyl-5-thioribose-1-phosphate isomerase [Endomicrobiales bacterium]|nr:S-methyl-5-thioribose-1-phosphate isomerase [Endomicrobiales bacterium]
MRYGRVKTFYWKNGSLYVLNQLLLPGRTAFVRCSTHKDVVKAIRDMIVRGAPAIGVVAAFGVALAAKRAGGKRGAALKKYMRSAIKSIAATRPTAVNLFWALDRMGRLADVRADAEPKRFYWILEKEALRILKEDVDANRKIGENGEKLIKRGSSVLTHCNAGALATAGYGTALGVIRSAHNKKKIRRVYVDETRPYLQGSRITAFELKKERIPYTLITDSMAGHLMKNGDIDAVIVGADRIAANGDVANKIGTYPLSILAKYHDIPFYVAAPVSTVDFKTGNGSRIRIEERSPEEVLRIGGVMIAPEGSAARHPGFDVTPAGNITAVITEKGVFKPARLKKLRGVK